MDAHNDANHQLLSFYLESQDRAGFIKLLVRYGRENDRPITMVEAENLCKLIDYAYRSGQESQKALNGIQA